MSNSCSPQSSNIHRSGVPAKAGIQGPINIIISLHRKNYLIITETWWWNEEVAETVREKKIKYRKWKREHSKEAWMEYKKCRQSAKRVISSAKEKKQKECASDLNDPEHQNEIF